MTVPPCYLKMNNDELKEHLEKIAPSSIFIEQVGDEVKCHISPERTIVEDHVEQKTIRVHKTPVQKINFSPIKSKAKKTKMIRSDFGTRK